MNFEAVIGLEIHVEMKTKSKMFSSSPVKFGETPNTLVTPLDMAFPGTMPVVNKQAVINAIRVCHALNMTIDHELWFDRKNYFYSDLPKGYQITQQARPIGKEGYLIVSTKDGERKIEIERLHMEEDTCKQLHSWDCSLLDYNRAGIPLIEIVSKPDIRTGEEAMKYVEKIRSIVSFLGVSDGKMEEGSLRCDVNISIRPVGSEKLGTKVEIKNLNSIANVEKAINYEFNRQVSLVLNGEEVGQETRRFDEGKKETVLMRVKTDAVDYKYFTEPNITPIKLSDEFINNAIKTSNELADSRLARYHKLGLNDYDSSLLIQDIEVSDYFDDILKCGASAKVAANWVNVDIQSILNKNNISISDFPVSSSKMATLIKALDSNKITNKQAREIFNKLLINNNFDLDNAIKELSSSLISSDDELQRIINEIIDNNPQSVIDYKAGKDRAVGFLMGQLMKRTQGKVNPSVANKMIVEQLKNR
ncbi:MAG: Asp-tRNA(Asn)/Glu-tRNA(Gln) amidotransferase subunit GatB [Bacilli bacterium]